MSSASTGGSNYISSANSSTTPLAANATFTGTAEDVTIFKSVVVSVYTDVSSANNGLSVQFSSDGTNWDFTHNTTITGGIPFSQTYQVLTRYFRLVYTNGASPQTVFRLQTILVDNQDSTLTSYSNNAITPTYNNIMNPVDSFGDVSFTEKQPRVIINFQYNINAAVVTTSVTGSATITQANAMAQLVTGTTTGSTADVQSNTLAQYTPGTGLRAYITGVFNTGIANTFQWIGIGNANNGYFFGYNGTQFSIRHLNNGSNTYIPQTSWNVDTMDGNSPSKITLNPQTGNVYFIKVQWLGYGVITFYIENPLTGLPQLVHIIRYPNSATVPSLDKTGFYCLASNSNGTTTNSITTKVTCIAVYLEGNIDNRPGVRFSIFGNNSVAANTLQSILSIRVKTTFAATTNFIPIIVDYISMGANGNKPVRFDIIRNPTNTFTFTDINTNQSVVEYSSNLQTITTNTNTATVMTFFLGNNDSQTINMVGHDFYMYPGQTYTIASFTTNATNDQYCSITWREYY